MTVAEKIEVLFIAGFGIVRRPKSPNSTAKSSAFLSRKRVTGIFIQKLQEGTLGPNCHSLYLTGRTAGRYHFHSWDAKRR